ncbi:MAG: glycosyltransferase family 9 protein [Limisphaerales bacterium]
MEKPHKILALQFKYFGDAVLMTPALRAIRETFPQSELHVLVPDNIAPVLQHLPWINRIWPMPRKRGRASLSLTWPVIRALRRERFDRSVDFASNDRGAILSFLIGAKQRLGWAERGGFFGRQFCYNQHVTPENQERYESARLSHLLSAWGISTPSSLALEIQTDPAKDRLAAELLPLRTILCHMASSQTNRQWPVQRWADLYHLSSAAGQRLAFTTATGAREQALTDELEKLVPGALVLSPIPELALFLAVLKRADVFISGDTGPLHFAAGLGVPTVALFGPSSPARWAPIGAHHRVLTGSSCSCGAGTNTCVSANYCLAAITPEQVFAELKKISSAA